MIEATEDGENMWRSAFYGALGLSERAEDVGTARALEAAAEKLERYAVGSKFRDEAATLRSLASELLKGDDPDTKFRRFLAADKP